jgi:hypothetical protein
MDVGMRPVTVMFLMFLTNRNCVLKNFCELELKVIWIQILLYIALSSEAT